MQAPGGQTRVLGRTAAKHDVAAHDVAFPPTDRSSLQDPWSCALRDATAKVTQKSAALSLFGGAVTARSVALAASKDVADSAIRIDGLTIAGKAASLRSGRPQSVGNWGYALADAEAGGTDAGALAVHLTKARAGLPAGTVLLVSFVRVPPAPKTGDRPGASTHRGTEGAPSGPRAHATQGEPAEAKAAPPASASDSATTR